MKDTWTVIEDRITAMSDRNKAMDATAALLYWDDDPYKLYKPDGKTLISDALPVTPNLPKVFALGVISDLMSAKMQTVVEGKVSGPQSHFIEQFVNDNLAQADEFLPLEYGIPSLLGWLCNHICLRWAIGARWISQIVGGQYKIDCLPVDMRWTPFVLGKWVAPIFKLTGDELRQELEKYDKKAKDFKLEYTEPSSISDSAKNEVRDYWSNEWHELWVAKQKIFTEPNSLGYPPFVIVIPATGFMLMDEGYLRHQGEDILFPDAGLYKELARTISLEQTAGYAGVYPAYEKERKNLIKGAPSEPVPKIDESLDVLEGERHSPVPRGDFNIAAQTSRIDIKDMVSVGAPLSPRQYNTPPSAIELAGETELIARLQNPRKDALGIFYSLLAKMMIEQFIKVGKGKAEFGIGKQGKITGYSASKLGNPKNYTITYHLAVKSKRQELANLAEFKGVCDVLPLEWTLPNILMADDPAGIISALKMRDAKRINPALDYMEMGLKFLEEAGKMEDGIEQEIKREQAKVMAHEYVMAMRARIQPAPAPAKQIEAPKGDAQLLSVAAGALRGEPGRVGKAEEVVT